MSVNRIFENHENPAGSYAATKKDSVLPEIAEAVSFLGLQGVFADFLTFARDSHPACIAVITPPGDLSGVWCFSCGDLSDGGLCCNGNGQ